MARDTDGTIRQATSLGTFADDTITLRNRLNSATSDFRDFYSFNLAVRSRVNIAVGLLQDNVALALLNSQGRKLEVSNRAGDRPERIQRELNEGTYYIAVVLFGTRTSYGMRIRPKPLEALPAPPGVAPVPPPTDGGTDGGVTEPPTVGPIDPGEEEQPNQDLPPGPPPVIPSPDPGPIPARAFDIGNLTDPVSYQQTVGGIDENGDGVLGLEEIDFGDFYKFTLTQPAEITLLTGNVSEGNVSTSLVYDINGNGAFDVSESDQANEVLASGNTITRSLGAGTYFIGVELGSGGNVTYSFQLSQIPITDLDFVSFPPTIGLQTAVDLGTIDSGEQNIRQLIGTTNPIDVYKFNLTNQATNISAILDQTQLQGDVTFSIVFDTNNDGVASPTRSGFDNGDLVEGLGDFVAGTFTQGSGSGGATLALTDVLTAGTYYLIVTQRRLPVDNTPYKLRLFTDPVPLDPTADSGGSLNTATLVDLLPLSVAANRDPANFTQYTQVVGQSDQTDSYRFNLATESNVIISYRGLLRPVSLRFWRDLNGNNVPDFPEDGTGFVTNPFTSERVGFGLRDGLLNVEEFTFTNPADSTDSVTIVGTEDRNGNGVLDRNEVLEPEPTVNTNIYGEFPVEYNPLPPFPTPSNDGFSFTEAFDEGTNSYITSVPTLIYARLEPGTYSLQVNNAAASAPDLGDGVTRTGPSANTYSVSFFLDG